MTRKTLSEADVATLLADPSGAARANTAAKLAHDFGAGELTAAERTLAEDIFRLMVRDAEVRVREALALNLKDTPLVPHDVARALADDVDSVALPVIEYSQVLTDRDLIEIIRGHTVSKQVAIARRPRVSETVSGVLVDTHDAAVVSTLVANRGADISDKDLREVVETFGTDESIQAAMVHRPRLPITVAERLVALVSENLKDELARRHELPGALATDLLLRSRERATLGLSSEGGDDELERLVRQLRDHGRLTPSIVLRALCMGDIRFFEAAVAELAGIPLVNARQLVHDSGPRGLTAVYARTALPAQHFPAVRAAIDVARETDYDGGDHDRERFSRRMLERVLTQYGDLGVRFDSDDLEYLLAKMNDLSADSKEGKAG